MLLSQFSQRACNSSLAYSTALLFSILSSRLHVVKATTINFTATVATAPTLSIKHALMGARSSLRLRSQLGIFRCCPRHHCHQALRPSSRGRKPHLFPLLGRFITSVSLRHSMERCRPHRTNLHRSLAFGGVHYHKPASTGI